MPLLLKAVSKFQIAIKGKAPLDEKAEHIQSYASILKKAATPPLDVRWNFETASKEMTSGVLWRVEQ